MHMDVKEPAKLGVRFNWCKCVSGGWQPSLHRAVARQGGRAAPAQRRHRCRVTRGAQAAQQGAKLPWRLQRSTTG